MSRFAVALTLLGLFCALTLSSHASGQKAGDLKIEPYTFETGDKQKIEAELGHLLVPENRHKPASRLIELAFVRFKSTSKNPGSPIVYLEGGPGGSGISAARGPALTLLMALREIGDVILLDQRGTGMSQPQMICARSWDFPLDHQGDPGEWIEIAKQRLRECADEMRNRGIDLSGYNTSESADDLDALRQALGLKKISLWGISYGTHLALDAIRRHQLSIDRAILTGVNGPDQLMMKLPSTIEGQIVKIDRLFKADPSISKAVPDLPELIKTLLNKLEKNPVTVDVTDPRTRQKVKVTVGRWDLQFHIASPVTQTWSIMRLPQFFYAMSKGDFTPLAERALEFRKSQVGSMMSWMMLSYSGVSRERQQQIERESKTALLDNAINFPYPEIRETLGSPDLGAEFRRPIKSKVPVLMISGTLDGRTPVENAEEIRKGFSESEHLILEGASHGYDLFFFIPQTKEVMLEFLKGQKPSTTRVTLSGFQFAPISEQRNER